MMWWQPIVWYSIYVFVVSLIFYSIHYGYELENKDIAILVLVLFPVLLLPFLITELAHFIIEVIGDRF